MHGLYSPCSNGMEFTGSVIASGNPNDTLLNERVFLNPSRGWVDDPDGPESAYVPHDDCSGRAWYVIVTCQWYCMLTSLVMTACHVARAIEPLDTTRRPHMTTSFLS